MNTRKTQQIKEQLEEIEECLANAEKYVARNVNVEGTSWLHFADWAGQSGHPSWIKNHMIPTTLRHRARKEKAIDKIVNNAKEKRVAMRKQNGRCP